MSRVPDMKIGLVLAAGGLFVLFHLIVALLFSGRTQVILQTIVIFIAILTIILSTIMAFRNWNWKIQYCSYMMMLMMAISMGEHIAHMQESLPYFWVCQLAISLTMLYLAMEYYKFTERRSN